MNKTLLSFILSLLIVNIYAQGGSVTDIQTSQRSDGSGFVDVYFDLSGPASDYNITMKASFNGGSNYSPMPTAFLSGDIAGITPGSNKHIVWDGLGSFPNTFSAQARLELTASALTCGQFTDPRDGQTYNTVQIGNQCWMKENLKFLPAVVGPGTGSDTAPYYYVYDYDGTNVSAAKATANYQNYGALYNWPAALTACPTGWHLPSDAEWGQLMIYLDNQGYPEAGYALKSCRQVDSPLGGDCNTSEHPRWEWPPYSLNYGFDEFGFSAFPGGVRYANGDVSYLGYYGYWWSSTEFTSTNAWYMLMHYNYAFESRSQTNKGSGMSVRCLRD